MLRVVMVMLATATTTTTTTVMPTAMVMEMLAMVASMPRTKVRQCPVHKRKRLEHFRALASAAGACCLAGSSGLLRGR
eukprot:2775831-Alexandrium_andersonii.AAC.1